MPSADSLNGTELNNGISTSNSNNNIHLKVSKKCTLPKAYIVKNEDFNCGESVCTFH